MEWDLLSPEREFIRFENYITAVSDPTLQKVFGNTFAYVFVCVPLMVVISLVLALMLNQIVKGRSFFRLIVFILRNISGDFLHVGIALQVRTGYVQRDIR